MPLSRRSFLEVSALSASGIALSRIVPQVEAAQTQSPPGNPPGGAFHPALEARAELSMNRDWQFFRPRQAAPAASRPAMDEAVLPADAQWEPATLPHTVRLEPRDVGGGLNYQGVCWYQKSFDAQPAWRNRVIYLKFQAAMQVANVWLNGVPVTTHYGGYIPFTIDISRHVRFDRANLLVVRLDNSDNPEVPPGKPQDTLDFCYFGGLYRGVDLEVMQPLHITDPILANKVAGGGIFVTYPAVTADEATVRVQTEIANESDDRLACSIAQQLIGVDGQLAASATTSTACDARASATLTQTMRVRNPRLWHPDDPQLYWLHTTVSREGQVTDDLYTRIGIRSIRFEKERGLLINGQKFFSLGANRHQDHPYVGYALPPSAHYRDAYKLKEAGFTSYRCHYPQDPSFMDACDELGILAVVSNPGWQFVGDEIFKQRAYQDAREVIRRDRNRPSVAIWEVALNESDNTSLAAEFYRIAHEEFPGPGCYTAGDPINKPIPGFPGWDIDYSRFRGNPPDRPSWIREWGDQVDNWTDQQGRVRVARLWGETPMSVETQSHMQSMEAIYASAHMPAGADLWAGIDYYRGYHRQPFLGAPLDVFRLPKFDYYMFQSQRPAQVTPVRAGSGPMVFIANFATFHSPLAVMVFSNCEEVRLTQNGTVVATQAPDTGYHIPHPPFTFKVSDFSPTRSMLFAGNHAPPHTEIGELLAEGLMGGTVVASHRVHSPGVATNLQLVLDTCGVDPVADGSDWVRAYAHVCDARGMTYPYSDEMITFTVSGEGSLIGGEANFANPLRAEAGIATALVRTTPAPGLITVRATSPGLKEAVVQFASIARR